MKEATRAAKQAVIDEIKTNIEESESVVLVQYSGLSVKDITELRNKFREKDAVYKVYKNTMAYLALQDLGYEEYDELLKGPNAFIFSKGDMVSGPKIAKEFAKSNKGLVIKAGLMNGNILDEAEVNQLAELPTKEELLGQVLRGLQGPISGLVNVCQGSLRNVVYALNAIKEKKESEAA